MGGKSSAPATPDYTAAANATAAGNLQQAQYQTQANRVNQVGPNGSLTYSQGPATFDSAGYDAAMNQYNAAMAHNGTSVVGDLLNKAGPAGVAPNRADFMKPSNQWTATQTLSPDQQALHDKQDAMSLQYANLGQQGLNVAGNILGNPMIDESKLAHMPQNAGTTTQDAMMQRLAPQQAREDAQMEAKLANQGIMPGSEAYNTAHTLQSQQHNDQQNQAALAGIQTDMQARNQGIANESSLMNQPINMINALRTGSQVTPQNFVNPAQQGQVQGPDLTGAMQGMYNANLGNVNAQNAQQAQNVGAGIGLGTLGYLAFASDRRLKHNIVKIGEREDGLNVYEFDYKPGFDLPQNRHIGVMADEVEKIYPDAVLTRPDGYKMVNYSRINHAIPE